VKQYYAGLVPLLLTTATQPGALIHPPLRTYPTTFFAGLLGGPGFFSEAPALFYWGERFVESESPHPYMWDL